VLWYLVGGPWCSSFLVFVLWYLVGGPVVLTFLVFCVVVKDEHHGPTTKYYNTEN
jgi:hypothetical protein